MHHIYRLKISKLW